MTTYDVAVSSLKEKLLESASKVSEQEYTTLPARITSTKDYEKLQCVSVEVLIKDLYEAKGLTDVGTLKLEKVFVNLPRFGGWQFRFPVAANDPVTLYWSRKDLSQYLDGFGDVVTQQVNDVAGLEDCFVKLEGGTRKNHNNPSLTDLEIEGKSAKITVTPQGDITTTTSGNIKCTAEGTYDITAAHLTIHNDTTIKNNLLVEGNTTTKGTTTSEGVVNADSGVHASTYAGTGGGAASFAVDMGINGTVTINGIVVNTHIHIDAEGRPTEEMQ